MKAKYYFFSTLLLAVFILTSATSQLFNTALKINVRNELGNIEAGATVTLYKTKEDYEKNQNPVKTGKTDEKGNVLFEKLETVSYYVQVEKGDKNNFGAGEQTGVLSKEKLNKATIIISE